MKYLFLLTCLVCAMGAACQKDTPPTSVNETDVPTTTDVLVETCQGTPAECFAECGKMSDALQKETCYLNILNEQTTEFCGQVEDTVLCNEFFVWQSAINASDCAQITNSLWQARCFESFPDTQKVFNEADFDQDGLSNQREQELGTDFRKADTDGDGYSDYDEVQAGYDPLTAAIK